MSNPNRRLIAEHWNNYARMVLPKNCPTVQRVECRRAFYAGAYAFFQATMAALDPDKEVTEEDMEILRLALKELGEEILRLGLKELEEFNEEAKRGRA